MRSDLLCWLSGFACLLLGLAGCEQVEPERSAPLENASHTPQEAILHLRSLRDGQRFQELAEGVVPEHAGAVVATLMAVDDFLGANRRLCRWVRDKAGMGLSRQVDQAYLLEDLGIYLGDGLGVFSSEVALLDVSNAKDVARVSYAVPRRVLAREAVLRRVDGTWRLDPSPCCSADVSDAFRELARGVDAVFAELDSGRITPDELRDQPELLIEKMRLRLRRGVWMLSEARAAEPEA